MTADDPRPAGEAWPIHAHDLRLPCNPYCARPAGEALRPVAPGGADNQQRAAEIAIRTEFRGRLVLTPEIAAALDAAEARGRAEALRKTADAWQFSAWANMPHQAGRAVERMAAAQYVTDWLRARLNEVLGQRRRPVVTAAVPAPSFRDKLADDLASWVARRFGHDCLLDDIVWDTALVLDALAADCLRGAITDERS